MESVTCRSCRVSQLGDTAVPVRWIPPRERRVQAGLMHLKDDELASALSATAGEDLIAAAYARVDTALGFTRILTPLGTSLIARPAARATAGKITRETS